HLQGGRRDGVAPGPGDCDVARLRPTVLQDQAVAVQSPTLNGSPVAQGDGIHFQEGAVAPGDLQVPAPLHGEAERLILTALEVLTAVLFDQNRAVLNECINPSLLLGSQRPAQTSDNLFHCYEGHELTSLGHAGSIAASRAAMRASSSTRIACTLVAVPGPTAVAETVEAVCVWLPAAAVVDVVPIVGAKVEGFPVTSEYAGT